MNLKDQIEEAGLSACIQLLGYHTDLEKYVNASDLVVSASKREGLPLNIMEAMLCGKAVVASNNRGHRELIENSVTGTVVAECSPNQIAEATLELIEDSGKRKNMGMQPRKLFSLILRRISQRNCKVFMSYKIAKKNTMEYQ